MHLFKQKKPNCEICSLCILFKNCLQINVLAGATVGLELPSRSVSSSPSWQPYSLFIIIIIITHSCWRPETSNIWAPREPKKFPIFFLSPNIVTLRMLSAQDIQKSKKRLKDHIFFEILKGSSGHFTIQSI